MSADRRPLLSLFLLALSSACAVDASEPEPLLDSEQSLAAEACPAYSALNAAHVSAGRAYTTTRYVNFRRVTTYYARGSNESLGTSALSNNTLYQIDAGTYSLSAERCAASDGGAVLVDAGTPAPVDASAPVVDAGSGSTASPGCGLTPPSSGSGKTVVVNGVTRTYVLALPTGYDARRAYPLLFAFHGLGGSGAQAQLYFGLTRATAGEAIIVYPDAVGSSRAWGISGSAATADLAFFDTLVNTLGSSLCVDRSRIFAAGHSMGGYFSNTLGCARGNTLRAIAPVAGGGPYVTCDSGKVAAWVMAARDDGTVAYTNGEASRDRWLRANGCSSTTRPVGPSACVAYDGCDPAHPVHWCLEQTGGHSWPSYGGQAIWSFFKSL